MPDLSSLIKAYDVRGVVPDQWDEEISRAIGSAFAEFVVSDSGATAVVTAHDMRESSIPLSRAFAEGVISRGVDVVEAGLGSTDLLYFAAGSLGLPGAMFTASHNPAQYNGIKMCRAGAAPILSNTTGAVRPAIPFPASTTTLSRRPPTGARASRWAA